MFLRLCGLIDDTLGPIPAEIAVAGSLACTHFPSIIIRSEAISQSQFAIMIESTLSTGKKPFSCDVCGRGFSTPSGRSRHRISVHRHDACGHNHTV